MTRTRLTLTLLAAALCGCKTTQTVTRQPVGDIAPGAFQVAWTIDAKATAPTAFYFLENTIFIYEKGNVVSAYDINGGLKFRTTVGEAGDLVGMPIVQPDRVIFPTSGALDLYTPSGVKTKALTLPQPIRSPGVVVGDSVFVGTDSDTGGRLASINLTRSYNVYNWTVLTGIINTKPVIFDNTIYCATEDGRVYAITQDKAPLWGPGPEMPDGLFHADGKIIAPIKADEGGVYVPSTDTKLYCLAPNTGRMRWQYFAGVPLTTSPTITADTVYQYVPGSGIVALPKKSLERTAVAKWSFDSGKQVLADDGRYAYILDNGNAIVAVSKADGTAAFRTQRNDISQAVTNPDPKNPAAFVLTKSGQLLCITPVLKTGVVGQLAMLTGD
ncbi:MAG TPA: PQQ-binding-like beta-propeller repeat protein [Tepidisphaeraceae bacterium]